MKIAVTFDSSTAQATPTALRHRTLTATDLPGGWFEVHVPGVDHPVVLGPGGVFVLAVRSESTVAVGLPVGPAADRPWAHDHRDQRSSPQLTAELATQLINWACGTDIACTPVIVVTGAQTEAAPRPDGVAVISEHLLLRWLTHLPTELDEQTIGLVVEHLTANTDLIPV